MENAILPKSFFWRRFHSAMGLWLVVYIIMHLLTNSQAALLIGDDGSGFIHSVNSIHQLPYLPLLELFIIGVPIVFHAYWGIVYLRTSKLNSMPSDGSTPSLPYPRNKAFTWQRITSWILLFGIAAHIIHMRFLEYPAFAQQGNTHYYMVRVNNDDGLKTVAARLGVELYTQSEIEEASKIPKQYRSSGSSLALQEHEQQVNWIKAIQAKPLGKNEIMAVSNDFGTAELLMLRNTFQSPLMILLYTLLVISACYHGFNGLWAAMIKWGITVSERSQRKFLNFTAFLMVFVAFLGLAAVWGTYWINLKQ